MDELLNELSTSFSVSGENSHSQHPRWADFKNEGQAAEKQRSRRVLQMERQNKGREECFNRYRRLCQDPKHFEENEDMDTAAPVSAASTLGATAAAVDGESSVAATTKQRRSANQFADVLMLSEWLVDIPGELSTEWSMLPCPVGKRVLVVASRGSTRAYAKNGRLISTFQSALPGGHSGSSGTSTTLDCIQVKRRKQTFYVLDLLSWSGQQFTEMDFSVRHFFLDSKFEEMEGEKQRVPFPFISLPYCACNKQTMAEFMKRTFDFEMDGLLFYYNAALYTPGQTALVGWLKPWMLPEILSVKVPEIFLENAKAPSAHAFIEKFNKKTGFTSSIDKSSASHESDMQ